MGEENHESQLKSTLSFPVILLITVNSIMGTGIYFLPALGAKMAGPMSIISWAVLSVIGIFIAMYFGELASMFPKAGGIYEYCKQAYGSFTSFVIGWTTLIVGNITIAMLIVGAIRYLNPGMSNIMKIGLSLMFIFIFNFMAYRGMQTSAVMLVTFGFVTLASLTGLIIPGLFNVSMSNFTPFFTHSAISVFIAIFFIAETFFGWETVTFLAEETKNPTKVIPKALIIGTICISIICLSFVFISLGSMPWAEFAQSPAPLTTLANIFYGASGSTIFTLLVYLSIIGSVAGWIVSAPRLILALAQDKLFLVQCARIHPKNKTPYVAIIFQTVLTSIIVIIGAGSYETLLELLLPLVLIIYSATLLTVTILRFKMPELKRGYRAPAGKIGPILIVLFMISLIYYWVSHVHNAVGVLLLGLSFILIGVPIYLLLNLYYNPDAIQKLQDKLAHVSLLTENWNQPKRVRKEVLTLLGDIRGKNILEHGCGVGTLTLELAEAVGPRGKIYATNISKGEIEVLQARLNKNEIFNVSAIHDEHHASRIHPHVPPVDLFVSVGGLSYIQDIHKIASEIYKLIPMGGKICFVEYVDFYKILPNAAWIDDSEGITEIFRENGFRVRVIKKKGTLWNYLFIYGEKGTRSSLPYI